MTMTSLPFTNIIIGEYILQQCHNSFIHPYGIDDSIILSLNNQSSNKWIQKNKSTRPGLPFFWSFLFSGKVKDIEQSIANPDYKNIEFLQHIRKGYLRNQCYFFFCKFIWRAPYMIQPRLGKAFSPSFALFIANRLHHIYKWKGIHTWAPSTLLTPCLFFLCTLSRVVCHLFNHSNY